MSARDRGIVPSRLPWALAVLVLGTGVGASARQNAMSFERDINARAMFLGMRAAVLRGGGSIQTLRSIVAKGRSHFIAADGSTDTGDVEVRVLLPGRYLRIDTVRTEKRAFGVNAGRLVNAMWERDRPLETPERVVPALLERARRDFVLFMVGSTTYVMNEQPLVFHAIVTSAYSNDPYTLRATAERMAFTLAMDPKTRTPRTIAYEEDGRDISIAFDARQMVGGLLLPFHVAKTAGGRLVDELTFEQVIVNAPLTAADFAP